MSCKGICAHLPQPDRFNGSPYRAGFFFCAGCGPVEQSGIFIDPVWAKQVKPDWNGKNCPCCGRILKFKLSSLMTVRA
jgi:hypothetical protein